MCVNKTKIKDFVIEGKIKQQQEMIVDANGKNTGLTQKMLIRTLVFGSGMAAINAVLQATCHPKVEKEQDPNSNIRKTTLSRGVLYMCQQAYQGCTSMIKKMESTCFFEMEQINTLDIPGTVHTIVTDKNETKKNGKFLLGGLGFMCIMFGVILVN